VNRLELDRFRNGRAGAGRPARLVWLLIVLLLAAGCKVRWEGEWGFGSGSVHGSATLRHDGFPLAGAEVRLDGPTRRTTTTSRSGTFSFSGLPEGHYTVTLRALHGTYSTTLRVGGADVLHWRVEPAGYDRELFYQISGLKKYYVDGSGRLVWDYGRLARWEQPVIRIYMDVAAAPHGFDPAWPNLYWNEVSRWEDMLRGRIEFRRVYSAQDADVVVRWQPRGFLGDQAGVARHLAYYENGAIKRVLIEIDVGYGHYAGLWAHEFAHGMGIDHVTDAASVMYPWLESGQRTTFSSKERDHVRLVYDLPSGQRLAGGWGMAVMSGPFEEGDGAAPFGGPPVEGAGIDGDDGPGSTLEPDPFSGFAGHVTAPDGVHVAIDAGDAAWLMGL